MNDEMTNALAQFIRNAIEEVHRITANMPKPIMSLHISDEGKSVDLCLDTSKATYGDWIKNEGADITLQREDGTDRVFGARLPLYAKTLVVGGNNIPTLYFDLESGNQLHPPEAASLTPQPPSGRDAPFGPQGWFECENSGLPDTRYAFWWTGGSLITHPHYRAEIHVASYRNFRRLFYAATPAPVANEREGV